MEAARTNDLIHDWNTSERDGRSPILFDDETLRDGLQSPSVKDPSLDEKIRLLAEAGKLSGAALTEFLEREGLLRADLEQWRLALDDQGHASKATTKRIRKLERELARKEKALAEAAALLVLKKKVEHLYQEDEDDDTDEDSEK